MTTEHLYEVHVTWTGNQGLGTSGYNAFSRDHVVTGPAASRIDGSSDPAFRGDAARWNPEQLMVASLAQCHMLWYLHLAASAGVVVMAYEDDPRGIMREEADGSGQFEQVILRPRVTITETSDPRVADALHADVSAFCFIARSVNFPVSHEPRTIVGRAEGSSRDARGR